MRALVVVMLFVVAAATWFLTMATTDPGLALTGSEPAQGPEVRPSAASGGAPPVAPEANALPAGTVAVHANDDREAAQGLADAPTSCLVVIDHGTQAPVAYAIVRRVQTGDEIAFTDDRGRAALALREPEQLAIVRDGYLLRLVPARIGTTAADPQQVRLVRDQWSARVRLDCRLPNGSAPEAAFVRFRSVAKGAPAKAPVPADPFLQRAWSEHGMLAGRPVCRDVAVELGVFAADRVHRLASRQEVRFVVPGGYEVEVATLGGFVARSRIDVAAVAGVDAPLVTIPLEQGAFVGGTVVGGEPSAPLAGAVVTIEGGDPLGLAATTAADGTFRIGPLLPTVVQLHVRHGDHEPGATAPLRSPGEAMRVQLTPLPKTTLRGRVRVRPDLKPLAGAAVVWSPVGSNPIRATTAADGTFVVRATGTTPSRLTIQAPDHVLYAELVEPGSPFADYDVWPATLGVRLGKKLTALLEGVVVDGAGLPQAGVSVRWVPDAKTPPVGVPGRRVLDGGTLDLPLIAATGVDGAFRLETNHFGRGRLQLAAGATAGERGIEVEAVPGTTKNGLRLQR